MVAVGEGPQRRAVAGHDEQGLAGVAARQRRREELVGHQQRE
jgi:hypothetical protein